MEYTPELDQKMKRLACEWVLYKHPLLEKENATDKEWADWYDQLISGDISEYETNEDDEFLYLMTDSFSAVTMETIIEELYRAVCEASEETINYFGETK